jgi:enolase
VDAIQQAGYNTNQVKLAIDAAASEFYKDGEYDME